MTWPLVLPSGGWTEKRDGMCSTETSCKLLVFLRTMMAVLAYFIFEPLSVHMKSTDLLVFTNVQPGTFQTHTVLFQISAELQRNV